MPKTKLTTKSLYAAMAFALTIAASPGRALPPWHVGDPTPWFEFPDGKWPTLPHGDVRASVTDANRIFHYAYTATNPSSNRYPVYNFSIDVRKFPREPYKEVQSLPKATAIRIISMRAPKSWSHSGPDDDPGIWQTTIPSTGEKGHWILPGSTQTGFVLTTKEPPAIRDFVFMAWVPELYDVSIDSRWTLRKNGYDPGSPEYWEQLSAPVAFSAKTVGPGLPPDPFSVSTWTARMLSDAEDARKLGWIKTDEQLGRVRQFVRALNVRDLAALRKAVAAVAAYVQPEVAAGRMTSEADALLRLNAEYLLRRAEKESEVLKGK